MYGLASSFSAFSSLAGLRGRSTLFCICPASPWSARRVTGTVHRRVFCLVTGNAWEEPGKRTRVLYLCPLRSWYVARRRQPILCAMATWRLHTSVRPSSILQQLQYLTLLVGQRRAVSQESLVTSIDCARWGSMQSGKNPHRAPISSNRAPCSMGHRLPSDRVFDGHLSGS